MTELSTTPNQNPKLSKSECIANMARAQVDFAWFVENIVGETPWDYQREILTELSDPYDPFSRIAVHTGHGVGKTKMLAWSVAAFLFTRSFSQVVTTASVNRQVRDILWPQIHGVMGKVKKNLYKLGWTTPYNLLDMKLEINGESDEYDEWFAIGASSDTPENMEGFHARHVLYIVDEAKSVEKGIFEAIEGAMTGNIEARMIVSSTPPLAREGHFYELCSGRIPGWKIHHIDGETSPNVSKDWVEARKREWGETSPVYLSKVKGIFPDASENTLIPTSWVEQANERWLEGVPDNIQGVVTIGVDPARYGDDETVIAKSIGPYVYPLEVHVKQDTMQTAGQVIRAIETHQATQVNIDVIGLGAGVYDRAKEVIKDRQIPCAIKPVNVAQRAPSLLVNGERFRFKRMRDYLFWCMRQKLDPINTLPEDLLCLPVDQKLLMQLTSIRYKINSNGEIEIESKDDLKKRGYSSPDRAEAVMMSVTRGYEGWAITLKL